jgi:nucleotide-binding universal stress UspA family protein
MTSQILVTLDGSGLAECALPWATTLARQLPADLVLLRVVSVPPDIKELIEDAIPETEALIAKQEAEAREYLDRVANQMHAAGLSADAVVRRGPAADMIIEYAAEAQVQQIVMATHGYSGFSRWIHGSVADRVLQSADVPVLLVCANEKPPGEAEVLAACERILVPLDGSAVAEQVLPLTTQVAGAFEAEIILFQVPIVYASGSFTGDWYVPFEGVFETAERDAQAYLGSVASRLQAQGLQVSTAIQMGGVANAIIEHAEANQIDLIAMCTHGRTGLARWAMGSVADRVLRAGRMPLLLVRAQ